MTGQRESREEAAQREFSETLAASFRHPNRRRFADVRVVVDDSEDGRQVDVDDGRDHSGYPTQGRP